MARIETADDIPNSAPTSVATSAESILSGLSYDRLYAEPAYDSSWVIRCEWDASALDNETFEDVINTATRLLSGYDQIRALQTDNGDWLIRADYTA